MPMRLFDVVGSVRDSASGATVGRFVEAKKQRFSVAKQTADGSNGKFEAPRWEAVAAGRASKGRGMGRCYNLLWKATAFPRIRMLSCSSMVKTMGG